MKDWKKFAALAGVFLLAYFVPFDHPKVSNAIQEAFRLLQWYAVNHTLACVIPAMFIAGGISTFLSQASVMRYLGPRSNRVMAYGVASVAGMILAVCSCSVLPMFAGIYTMGAGLGPASAFLYSGPAINVLAVFLSARVLGTDLGVARAIGAIAFAVIIGLLMHVIFRRSEGQRQERLMQMPEAPASPRPLWKTALFFAAMILFLVFSDWYNTNDVTIALKDGTRIEANIRYSRPEALDVQEYDAGLASIARLMTAADQMIYTTAADTAEARPKRAAAARNAPRRRREDRVRGGFTTPYLVARRGSPCRAKERRAPPRARGFPAPASRCRRKHPILARRARACAGC